MKINSRNVNVYRRIDSIKRLFLNLWQRKKWFFFFLQYFYQKYINIYICSLCSHIESYIYMYIYKMKTDYDLSSLSQEISRRVYFRGSPCIHSHIIHRWFFFSFLRIEWVEIMRRWKSVISSRKRYSCRMQLRNNSVACAAYAGQYKYHSTNCVVGRKMLGGEKKKIR